jgi:hypothetical protein
MQKKVLLSLLILVVVAVAIYFAMTVGQKSDNLPQGENVVVPDVSTDIIWNAYTLNSTPFIYPADWTFEEVKDVADAKKITGFKVTNPISSNSFDNIEAGGACPEVTIPEIHNACINGIWLHTQSESETVLSVFADMKKFGEAEMAANANLNTS